MTTSSTAEPHVRFTQGVHFVDPKPCVPFSSLSHLLQHQAERAPDAPAILAPGRIPLTHGDLYWHIVEMGHQLRAMGIGRYDRVAVVLPNGPEMAVAVLTVAATAVCAPVNPAYRADELQRYFSDLRPAALIMEAGIDSAARHVALSCGVRVIELSTAADAEAGHFGLSGDHKGTLFDEPVRPGDVALLLPTSGTTSRPKIVPLTHANICASAYCSRAAFGLTETDRCLNVLPLFTGHSLIATVLASLAGGASVVCTPGCDVKNFFAWLAELRPTWYAAVPAMHQAILRVAPLHLERLAECRLRFVRSASAALSYRVLSELEQTFKTSVVQYYGMTETASAPIACTPLPPRQRKAGSVGVPVGLDVAIMDEEGALLPVRQTGQVVVRGSSVTPGYDGNPMANRAAFAADWFRTGDLGFFDDDGHLFLVGRSREIINRGGEKIVPQEIDEVLLEHPAVLEAVTFSVPHPTLGEDVASAVVLRQPSMATQNDIRHFVIGRVADFKVPGQVLVVSELPKTPTGKLQRVGLATKFGLAHLADAPRALVAPRTPLERMLAECWAEILQLEQVGIYDNFFALGGDSLSATHILSRVHEITHIEVEASRFFETPTIAEIAQYLETLSPADQAARASSAIARAPRTDGVPASIAQERLWKLQLLLPGVPIFNILHVLRVTSAVDAEILKESLNEIVRRHEILRTTFADVDGQCRQIIAPKLTVHLEFDDLRARPGSEKDAIAQEIIEDEALHGFDLRHGPLLRTRLMRLAEREHLLLITVHQTISDGWSLGVLGHELAALYDAFLRGEASPLAPLSIQFADLAYWQRQWKLDPDIVAQLEYWRQQLRDPLPAMELASASSSRTIDGLRTARRELALPAHLVEGAKRLSQREGVTLFMTLVAALKTLLHRYLGQDDLRVATLVANRSRQGTDGLVGPLVNTVILRTDLAGDPSPREVLRRVRATTLAAFAHQDLPFEELTEALARERAVKPSVLAQVMIEFQSATGRPMANSGTSLALEEANPGMLLPLVTTTTFDVALMLREETHGLAGCCVYKPHLFDDTTIDRLLQDFQAVLEQMVAQSERPLSTIRLSLKGWPKNAPLRS
jgi:acyl-CoA synthetase (AMP-forming)/AMP-acid ligase II/acyl carrier protein